MVDVIGMPICDAFAQIEQQPNIYDVVHVKYYDEVWLSCFLFVILYWLFLCGGVMIHGVLHAWKMSVFCLCSIVDAVMVVALFCLFFHFHLLTLFMCSAGASET